MFIIFLILRAITHFLPVNLGSLLLSMSLLIIVHNSQIQPPQIYPSNNGSCHIPEDATSPDSFPVSGSS